MFDIPSIRKRRFLFGIGGLSVRGRESVNVEFSVKKIALPKCQTYTARRSIAPLEVYSNQVLQSSSKGWIRLMPPRKKGLSKLDIFGLVSGIIGLIADVIGLSALFGLAQANVSIPVSSWVTTALLILYTGIVTGFYSRRIFCYMNQRNNNKKTLELHHFSRIEEASTVVTYLVVTTLCFMFLYSVRAELFRADSIATEQAIRDINEKYEKLKVTAMPEENEQLEKTRKQAILERESDGFGGKVTIIFVLGLLTFGGAAMLNYLSRVIYKGCDPSYEAN